MINDLFVQDINDCSYSIDNLGIIVNSNNIILEDRSVIETLIGMEYMNDKNTISQFSEPIVVLSLLIITHVGTINVPEMKLALNARVLSLKGLKRDLLARLVYPCNKMSQYCSKVKLKLWQEH